MHYIPQFRAQTVTLGGRGRHNSDPSIAFLLTYMLAVSANDVTLLTAVKLCK